MEHVGKRIRKIREKQGMTLDELGDKIGRTKSFLSKLETGKKPINLKNLQSIADALRVDIVDLFTERERVSNPFTNEEDWVYVVKELKEQGYSAGDVYLKMAQEAIEKDKEK